jgi:hypothetical protein
MTVFQHFSDYPRTTLGRDWDKLISFLRPTRECRPRSACRLDRHILCTIRSDCTHLCPICDDEVTVGYFLDPPRRPTGKLRTVLTRSHRPTSPAVDLSRGQLHPACHSNGPCEGGAVLRPQSDRSTFSRSTHRTVPMQTHSNESERRVLTRLEDILCVVLSPGPPDTMQVPPPLVAGRSATKTCPSTVSHSPSTRILRD